MGQVFSTLGNITRLIPTVAVTVAGLYLIPGDYKIPITAAAAFYVYTYTMRPSWCTMIPDVFNDFKPICIPFEPFKGVQPAIDASLNLLKRVEAAQKEKEPLQPFKAIALAQDMIDNIPAKSQNPAYEVYRNVMGMADKEEEAEPVDFQLEDPYNIPGVPQKVHKKKSSAKPKKTEPQNPGYEVYRNVMGMAGVSVKSM